MDVKKDVSLLNVVRLPGRLNTLQTAELLGFQEHDIPVLVKAKLLKPVGSQIPNAPKYFSGVEIEERRCDSSWLDRGTKTLQQHWHKKNQARRKSGTSDDSAEKA